MSMEFWGVEVKAGETVKAEPAEDRLIHLSHVALGEIKKDKGNESVALFVKIGDQKMVLGHLSTHNNQQIAFDLVFDKKVELSHNWKNGSVYFMGYEAESQEGEGLYSEDSDEEHQIGFANEENGSQLSDEVKAAAAAASKPNAVKPDSSSKQKVKSVQIKDDKADDESDEDESDEDDDDDEESDDDSEEGMSIDQDDDDDDDESENEDEETPKKDGKGKKKPNDSATQTPVPAKKQNAATPQKTDGKKSGHTATPHPAKGAAKIPANGTNTKPQTPKSGLKFSCGSCDRSFGSDGALQSHSKAKHGAK